MKTPVVSTYPTRPINSKEFYLSNNGMQLFSGFPPAPAVATFEYNVPTGYSAIFTGFKYACNPIWVMNTANPSNIKVSITADYNTQPLEGVFLPFKTNDFIDIFYTVSSLFAITVTVLIDPVNPIIMNNCYILAKGTLIPDDGRELNFINASKEFA